MLARNARFYSGCWDFSTSYRSAQGLVWWRRKSNTTKWPTYRLTLQSSCTTTRKTAVSFLPAVFQARIPEAAISQMEEVSMDIKIYLTMFPGKHDPTFLVKSMLVGISLFGSIIG